MNWLHNNGEKTLTRNIYNLVGIEQLHRRYGQSSFRLVTHQPSIRGLAVSAGVWLTAKEMELSPTMWLATDFNVLSHPFTMSLGM